MSADLKDAATEWQVGDGLTIGSPDGVRASVIALDAGGLLIVMREDGIEGTAPGRGWYLHRTVAFPLADAAVRHGSYLVHLWLECDGCATRLEIKGQPGAAPLAAYEQFVAEHAHFPSSLTPGEGK